MQRQSTYTKGNNGKISKQRWSKPPRPYGQALVPLGRKATTEEQVSFNFTNLQLPSLSRLTLHLYEQVQAENDWDVRIYGADDPDEGITPIVSLLVLRA